MIRMSLTQLVLLLLTGMDKVVSFAPPSSFHSRALRGVYANHRDDNAFVVTAAEQAQSSSLSTTTAPEDNNDPPLWDEILARFQGDFDNYRQVVEDRSEGLLPRELGGHEHIHCTLVPVATTARLAAFYFDGDPTAIFRFRYYQLVPNEAENTVDTVLYTLDTALEGLLRQCPDPMQWKRIFVEENGKDRVTLLPKCDVRWSWNLDPVQHAYAVAHHEHKAQQNSSSDNHDDKGIHAVMVHGEALVESQVMPGMQILIRDQLSLWNDELWIHDRGFEPTTMKFIYGNQRGVPYRLERVANMELSSKKKEDERQVVNEALVWTLGPEHRTEEEYQGKLDKVGGPSRPKRR